MVSRYFELEQIARGTLHEEPFQWGQLVAVSRVMNLSSRIRWHVSSRLKRSTIVSATADTSIDVPSFHWRPIGSMTREHCRTPTAWDVRGTCIDGLPGGRGRILRNRSIRLPDGGVAFRGGRDTHYLPHVDASLRLGFRLIIYFNTGWKDDWGGFLHILDPRDHSMICHTISPKVGNATMIVRDGYFEDTWHEVTRLTSAGIATRNTLNVTYYQPSDPHISVMEKDGQPTKTDFALRPACRR